MNSIAPRTEASEIRDEFKTLETDVKNYLDACAAVLQDAEVDQDYIPLSPPDYYWDKIPEEFQAKADDLINRLTDLGNKVLLSPDVAAAFPDDASVNEALRSLIEIARKSTGLTKRSA